MIKSYMEGNKCGNVLLHSHWRTPPQADTHIGKKSISIIIVILIVVKIRRIIDLTIINLVHITTIGITLNNTK